MTVGSVAAMYFSPTGTTRRVVARIAEALSGQVRPGIAPADRDFTLPGAREEQMRFHPGDLVVFGVPVYAGRIPKLLVDYIRTVQGDGATAVAVVVYGNRDYDDALLELCDLLEAQRFQVAAAAAFIGEHSYTSAVARGRPDDRDLELATELASRVAGKLADSARLDKIVVKGKRPYKPYPVARDQQGQPIDLDSLEPETSPDCLECMTCVEVCPTGAIDPDDPKKVDGLCIRCNACVKACPSEAKYFSDSHSAFMKRWLEEHCVDRRSPELFL